MMIDGGDHDDHDDDEDENDDCRCENNLWTSIQCSLKHSQGITHSILTHINIHEHTDIFIYIKDILRM